MFYYNYEMPISSTSLSKEITAANLPLDKIETINRTASLFFTRSLENSEKSELDILVHTHSNIMQITNQVKSVIHEAMAFGQSVIVDYGVKNTLRGYTEAQIMDVSQALANVQVLLTSGALYSARTAIASIPEEGSVTADDKAEFIAKITEYLGE